MDGVLTEIVHVGHAWHYPRSQQYRSWVWIGSVHLCYAVYIVNVTTGNLSSALPPCNAAMGL